MSNEILFTRYKSYGTNLNKSFKLVDGHIEKKADTLFYNGEARTITLDRFKDFMDHLRVTREDVAFGYGICNKERIKICTKASGREDHEKYITRSLANFYYEGPSIQMFDYDPSPYYKNGLVLSFKQWRDLLVSVEPAYAEAEWIVMYSISACVVETRDSGRPIKLGAFHAYCKVKDGALIPSKGKLLHEKLRAHADTSFMALGASGSYLPKSIIDHCVFDPSRLDFVGCPTVGKGLTILDRQIEHYPGKWVDLEQIGPLKTYELNDSDELLIWQKADIECLRQEIIKKYDSQKVKDHMALGMTEDEARTYVSERRKANWLELDGKEILYLCNGKQMSVNNAVKEKICIAFADPIEGPDYSGGVTAALLMWKHGVPWIKSFAHGNTRYTIKGYKKVVGVGVGESNETPERILHSHNVHFTDALPASGKSTLLRKIIQKNKRQRYIIALPSTSLIGEYDKRLDRLKVDHTCVIGSDPKNRDPDAKPVSVQIEEAVKKGARVILITHNALTEHMCLELIMKCVEYNLVIDETFFNVIYKFLRYRLKEFIKPGSSLDTICRFQTFESYDVVTVKNREAYDRLINSNDSSSSLSVAKEKYLFRLINDQTREMSVRKHGKDNVMYVSVFRFEIFKHFKSVTVMASFFKESAMYHEMSLHFNMVDLKQKLGPKLRPVDYKKIRLWPLTPERYSLRMRDRRRVKVKGETYDLQQYTQRVMEILNFRESLRVLNKSDWELIEDHGQEEVKYRPRLKVCEEWVKGRIITANCAGINEYKDIHFMAYVAAFNLRPDARSYFRDRLPDYDLWTELNCNRAVQCGLRTSARDDDSEATVDIIVSDIMTAEGFKASLRNEPKICYHSEYKHIDVSVDADTEFKTIVFKPISI